ncbi:hypothetical protein JCM3765_002805 [Sporobolomyces pararoseus]
MLASLLARLHLISEPSPSPSDQVTSTTREQSHTPSSFPSGNLNTSDTSAATKSDPTEELEQEEEVETRDSSTPAASSVEQYVSPDGTTKLFPAGKSLSVGGGEGIIVKPRTNGPELSPEFSLAHRGRCTEEGKGLEHGYEKVENEVIAEFG